MDNSYLKLFSLIIFLSVSSYSYSQNLKYTIPLDKSLYNTESTNIVLAFNPDYYNSKTIKLSVCGSISGVHKGKTKIVNNKPLIVSFAPDVPFSLGEKVKVKGYNHSDEFAFFIREKTVSNADYLLTESFNQETQSLKPIANNYPNGYKLFDTIPVLTINQYGPTAPGNIFIANFSTFFNPTILMVLENNGTPKFTRKLRYRGYDFKKQNNYYIYWDEAFNHYKAIDSTFNVVDSFYCGNGYITNFHECILEPDNSAWLFSFDPQIVNMSLIYPGGRIHATVTGLIIQKINTNKDVVFQWRSWDHLSILDATHEDFTATSIDYVHGNSIEKDYDGNIIVSSRHLDEISKINSQTGEFIWRLGGKHNEYSFINDTAKFSHQHSARRLSNNNILILDNGNFHTPQISRVVEYKMYDDTKQIEMVWEYKNTPSIYSAAMGNVQRLSNGNTFIGWGSNATSLSEVTASKSVLYTLSLPTGQSSYRAFRFVTSDVINNINSGINDVMDYSLSQNFPNPFNPATKINFALPKSGLVTLKVYDMLGKEVSSLVNEVKNAGTYSVDFNAINLTSGIYFYKVNVNGFSEVRKMMLIK
jgi:hypothetical protein